MSFRCTGWKRGPACGLQGPAGSALLRGHLRHRSPTALGAPRVLPGPAHSCPRVSMLPPPGSHFPPCWRAGCPTSRSVDCPLPGVCISMPSDAGRPRPIPGLSLSVPLTALLSVSFLLPFVQCLVLLTGTSVAGGQEHGPPLIVPAPAPSTVPGSVSVQSTNQSIKTQWTDK